MAVVKTNWKHLFNNLLQEFHARKYIYELNTQHPTPNTQHPNTRVLRSLKERSNKISFHKNNQDNFYIFTQ